MKDKLIELILEAPQTPCVIGGRASGKIFQTAENIANHLIANGVTVLVQCGECAHCTNSRSVDCAYKCNCRRSPCYGRTTYADFGCLYGEGRSDHKCN